MIGLKRFFFVLAVIGTVLATSFPAPAQNMGGTVDEHQVHFPKGTHGTTVSGRAKYAHSYVYKVGVRSGQVMDLALTSRDGLVTFSLIAPDTNTVGDAVGIKTWSGELAQSGDYSIVVVMNDENAGSVPFTLKITAK